MLDSPDPSASPNSRFVAVSRYVVIFFLSTYLIAGLLFLGFNKSVFEVGLIIFICLATQLVQTVLWPEDSSNLIGTLITGVGLSILINAGHEQPGYYLFPCFVAIASKVAVRRNKQNIFNPSLVGILASILLTDNLISVTPAYQWGAQNMFSLLIIVPSFLIVLPLIRRTALTASFLGAFTIFLVIRAHFFEHSLPFVTLFLSSVTSPAFFLYACFMITDPPTSPPKTRDQIVVGVAIATVDFVFHLFHSYYTFFFAAGVVACSRLILSSLRTNGAAKTWSDLRSYMGVSRWRVTYFVIGLVIFNPLLWKNIQAHPVDPGFRFVEDTEANRLIESPMIDFRAFPIDERIRHLTKWLIFSEGVAVADVNLDGRPDLFVLNSLKEKRGVFLLRTETGGWTEVEIPEISRFLYDYPRYGLATSAVFADYDGDGAPDLFITFVGGREGGLKVFRSTIKETGVLGFKEVSRQIGLGDFSNSLGVTLADFNGDGRLDVFLATVGYDDLPAYEDHRHFDIFNLPQPEFAGDLRPTRFLNNSWYDANTSAENRLYLGTPQGFVRQDSAKIGLPQTHISLAVGSSDINHDGYPDIYVANDSGPDDFYVNREGRYFERVSGTNSREIGRDYYKGMNVTFADFNRDGTNEIYVSNIHHPFVVEGSLLWQFDPKDLGHLEKAEDRASYYHMENENRWGWGAAAKDFNLDGWTDLIQANGMFDASWEKASSCIDYFYLNEKLMRADSSYFENAIYWADTRGACLFAQEKNRVYLNHLQGDGFVDVAAQVGLAEPGVWRGVAAADFSNSGRQDVVVTSPYHQTKVFKNILAPTNRNSWIGFDLTSLRRDCTRDAVNSQIEIRYTSVDGHVQTQFQEKFETNGFSAQSDTRPFFGLGLARGTVEATVKWCGHFTQVYPGLELNRYHKLIAPAN